MCEFSGKLIAWLDTELTADEAAEVGRHLRGCAECRSELSVYERLSGAVDAYCEAALAASEPRKARIDENIKPVMWGAGAAAALALVVLLVALPHARKEQPAAQPMSVPTAARTTTVEEAVTAPEIPVKAIHRRRAAAPAQIKEARWAFAEPAIQITIPAEAVFPPGAVPEGVSYVADVRISAGGAAQQLLVWP
jgi:hypothetical protein